MYPKLLADKERENAITCVYSKPSRPVPFHFHSHIELCLIEEGELDVWVNNKYKRLHHGQIALSLSYHAHRYDPVGNGVFTWLTVPPSMCGEFIHKNISEPFITNIALFDGIKQCCSIISQKKNDLLTNGCISVVFGLLQEHLSFTDQDISVASDSMSQVLLYLNDHFKEDITLSSTASNLGFNATYLSHQFKTVLGIGFNQYLTMLRLREAIQLLRQNQPVSFCAYESGFRSLRTFYRAFSKEFGCTPREFQ